MQMLHCVDGDGFARSRARFEEAVGLLEGEGSTPSATPTRRTASTLRAGNCSVSSTGTTWTCAPNASNAWARSPTPTASTARRWRRATAGR